MKIAIHHYYHFNVGNEENFDTCDLAVNNGNGAISYHDWNVKKSKVCGQCRGKKIRNYYLNNQGYSYKSSV